MEYETFSESAPGKGHPCQDAGGALECRDGVYLACADGHGGEACPRSAAGARFAVRAALICMKEFGGIGTEPETELAALVEGILGCWDEMLKQDLEENPLTGEEQEKLFCLPKKSLYGTTLLGAGITDSGWFLFQIGDGACWLKQGGAFQKPVPEDARCAGCFTTSMCMADARQLFRTAWGRGWPEGVFLMTDGLTGSYPGGGETAFLEAAGGCFQESGAESGRRELRAALPVISCFGSGDDLTLTGAVMKKFL